MDTKKLRQKILDLATHGKLVPQDLNDEPASVLLKRIRAEKERLIKEGKIKKSKASKTSDTPHYENVPFEIPCSWEWTTLGEIFTLQAGKNITSKDISDKEDTEHRFPCYGGNGLRGYVCGYNRDGRFPLIGRQGALCGNINLADGLFYATEHAVVVETYCETNVDWAVHTLTHLNLNQYATSTAQPGLSVSTINEVLIPLPPIEEQRRIVSCLNKWFALIAPIEQGKVDLQTTIKQTKSKILDLAIHGKLVPQDPNDEPASELLKRINPDAEITCDNGQYGKIPKGWCLVTGTFLFKQMKSAKPKGKLFKYIDIDSIDNKSNIVSSIKEIPTIEAPSRASRYTEKGDVVFSMVRPYLRNIAQITENYCIASTGFYICSPYNCMLSKFCYYLMLSNYVVDGLNTFMKGDNSPSITKREIEYWLYPLPPMNEQYRIVAKIEEIFTILDRIELSLRMS